MKPFLRKFCDVIRGLVNHFEILVSQKTADVFSQCNHTPVFFSAKNTRASTSTRNTTSNKFAVGSPNAFGGHEITLRFWWGLCCLGFSFPYYLLYYVFLFFGVLSSTYWFEYPFGIFRLSFKNIYVTIQFIIKYLVSYP